MYDREWAGFQRELRTRCKGEGPAGRLMWEHLDRIFEEGRKLQAIEFRELEPGMHVEMDGQFWLVTDRTKVEHTAWENYPMDHKLLTNEETGEGVWVDGYGDKYPFIRLALGQKK